MGDPRSQLDRRRVVIGLGLLAGGGAAAAGLWWRRLAAASRRTRELAERRLLACFPQPGAIRALGERYLAAHPGEGDRRRLIELVLDDLGGGEELGTGRAFRLRVSELVRADFASGRTLRLDGWIVSRTEARLAALVAAMAGSSETLR